MRHPTTWTILLVAASACAYIPGPGEQLAPEPITVGAPAEVVWEALPAVYDRLGFDAVTPDSVQRSLFAVRLVSLWKPWIGPAKTPYMRCTISGAVAPVVVAARASSTAPSQLPIRVPPARVTFTLVTTLSQRDGETLITTRVGADPRADGGPGEGAYCVSTGRLEERVAELLQDYLEQTG